MSIFSFVASFPRSFYSRKLYQEAARDWKGFGFLRTFTLATFCALPTIGPAIPSSLDYINNAQTALRPFTEQVPEFRIKNGKFSAQSDMPYVIVDPKSGQEFVIIDTTGQITSLEGRAATALITESEVHMRDGSIPISLWAIDDFESDGEDLLTSIISILKFIMIAVEIAHFLLVFSSMLTLSLVLALLGTLLCELMPSKVDLSIAALTRIATVAAAPSWLLSIIFSLLTGTSSLLLVGIIFHSLIGSFYFGFGVLAQPAPVTVANHFSDRSNHS